jgi:hypothetical protein
MRKVTRSPSVNYRLVPEATVEQQAADIAARWPRSRLARHARVRCRSHRARRPQRGSAPRRAGRHRSAYLRDAGLSFADIDGVVPLDGAAFDATNYGGAEKIFTGRMFDQAFGDDRTRQARLSPTLQAAAPNVAHFAILHIDRPDSRLQSGELARALQRGGTEVELESFAGRGLRGHAEINRRMGDPTYPATPVLDAFLARVFS